jgi:hypothetical protein
MPLIERDAIPAVPPPEQTVPVSALNGEVLVRGMSLPHLMQYNALRRRQPPRAEYETESEATERIAAGTVPLLLHLCVLAADGLPVYTQAQWEAWAPRHMGAAIELANTAMALSGQGADEKNA